QLSANFFEVVHVATPSPSKPWTKITSVDDGVSRVAFVSSLMAVFYLLNLSFLGALRRVAHAFDLAGITNTVGCPVLRVLGEEPTLRGAEGTGHPRRPRVKE